MSLVSLIESTSAEIASYAKSHPEEINVRDPDTGYYPVHLAATKGNVSAVQALASNGADLSVKTLGGKTIWDIARAKKYDALAALESKLVKPVITSTSSASSSDSVIGSNVSCVICGSKENLSRCARCKRRFFCGVAHQKQDWPSHRSTCNLRNTRIVLSKKLTSSTTTLDASFFTLQSDQPLPETTDECPILVKNVYLSVDPYMRGRMSDAPSYASSVSLGDVMLGETIAQVIETSAGNHPFKVGDWVRCSNGGWQLYCSTSSSALTLISTSSSDVPLVKHLSLLGMPSVTAWHMVFKVIRAQPGETILVSSASGAVGLMAAQMLKHIGCRVVALAGSDAKCAKLKSHYGLDVCINYKTYAPPQNHSHDALTKATERLTKALLEATQGSGGGYDGYCDQVGGWILNAALAAMKARGRIAVCGRIASWSIPTPLERPELILIKQLRLEGFIVPPEAFAPAREYIGQKKNIFKAEENISKGIENTINAFLALFNGDHFGKQIVEF